MASINIEQPASTHLRPHIMETSLKGEPHSRICVFAPPWGLSVFGTAFGGVQVAWTSGLRPTSTSPQLLPTFRNPPTPNLQPGEGATALSCCGLYSCGPQCLQASQKIQQKCNIKCLGLKLDVECRRLIGWRYTLARSCPVW